MVAAKYDPGGGWPSDGVVFIDSCAAEDGIGNVAGSALLPWNHLQLLLMWLGE